MQWRWRYAVLTADRRFQTFTCDPASSSPGENHASITEDLDVRGALVAPVGFSLSSSLLFGFRISQGRYTIRLAADSHSAREAWIQAIAAASGSRREVEGATPHSNRIIFDPLGGTDLVDAAKGLEPVDDMQRGESLDTPICDVPVVQDACGSSEWIEESSALPENGTQLSNPPPPKGKGKGMPPPPKGKGKGMPPPPKGKGKGMPPPKAKGKNKSPPVALPIGRRLSVQTVPGAEEAEAFMYPTNRVSVSSTDSGQNEAGSAIPRSPFDPTAVDFGALRHAFTLRPRAAPEHRNVKTNLAGIEFFPQNVAQNILIVLRKLRDSISDLAEALDRLAPTACSLTSDEAERLVTVLPPPDRLLALADHVRRGNDPSRLRDVERRLLPLASLPRLASRLQLLVVAKTLDDRLGDAVLQMSVLQGAVSAVCNSEVLRDLLQIVLVLFNYVNYGEEPPPDLLCADVASSRRVRTVDVQSLRRLQETQAYVGPFPRYHMLHFCVEQFCKQRPELRCEDLYRELGALPKAAGMSLDQLERSLEKLREDLVFVQSELYGHPEAYGPQSVFESDPQTEPSPEAEPASLPTEQPPAEPSPQGPEQFSLEHSDSDEHDSVEASEEASETMSLNSTGNLLSRLRASVPDTREFLKDVAQGTAAVGCVHHAGEPTLADDGDAPPPGFLQLLKASGIWRRCFSEVRASLLVLYRISRGKCIGTSYVILPSSEVVALDSVYASERARKISAMYPHGFEIQPTGGGRVEILRANSAVEARRWIKILGEQSRQWGVGQLSLYVPGLRLGLSYWRSWRRLYCIIEDAGDTGPTKLLGFARPRDHAEGVTPEKTWNLDAMTVRCLHDDGASTIAKQLFKKVPIGLELEDSFTGHSWHFACDSLTVQQAWIDSFHRASQGSQDESSGARPNFHTLIDSFRQVDVAPVNNAKLFNLFESSFRAPAPSSSPICHDFDAVEHTGAAEGSAGCSGDVVASVNPGKGAADTEIAVLNNGVDRQRGEEELEPEEEKDALHGSIDQERHSLSNDGKGLKDPFVSEGDECSTVDSAKDQAACKSSTEGPPRPLEALSQLRRLEEDVDRAVKQWERMLAATQADCRRLLRFFGHEVPSDSLLGSKAGQLLQALATFKSQVHNAWRDLIQHKDSHARAADAAEPTAEVDPKLGAFNPSGQAKRRSLGGPRTRHLLGGPRTINRSGVSTDDTTSANGGLCGSGVNMDGDLPVAETHGTSAAPSNEVGADLAEAVLATTTAGTDILSSEADQVSAALASDAVAESV